jgi:hypothetical protein
MATDGKSFDKRILLGGEIRRWVEFSCWDNELRAEAAVAVYAKRLMMLTAICFAKTT